MQMGPQSELSSWEDFQFIIDIDTIFKDCRYVWGINEGILPDLLGQDALQYYSWYAVLPLTVLTASDLVDVGLQMLKE